MSFRLSPVLKLNGGIAIAAMLALSPCLAQPREKPSIPQAPSKLPRVDSARTKNLDFLFSALKAAPDEDSARAVEARIWAIWMKTPSDTAALLMARAQVALEAKKLEIAQKLLDAIIKIRPDYVEAWNKRATLFYLENDYTHSLDDIQEVLRREPRHFGALAGLGIILQETGDDKHALAAFRRALEINPHLDKVPDLVKTLTEKVEGRDI
ncbi:MAG: tetratricopeptide repeat protein [Xanthobacteraceae bacterium]|nr:tetratricopeptide repeat protein [Xanthobacteraceae bacterium]